MATGTLTGQTIANTYKALLKITGTTAGGETLHATTQKEIEDGDGNPFPFSAAQDAILMTGTRRIEFNVDGEYISGDGTDLTITSSNDIVFALGATGSVYHTGDGGSQNTIYGYDAGVALVSSCDNNVLIGYNAGNDLNSGDQNVIIGHLAGDALLGGEDNVFVGQSAGGASTAGTQMTIVGRNAGISNLTAAAVGSVLVGKDAGGLLTEGIGNTAVGYQAMYANSTSDYNTAVGDNCLVALTNNGDTGNTAVGWHAGLSISSGSANTIMGATAGDGFDGESHNTLIGYGTGGHASYAAQNCTAVGSLALSGAADNDASGTVAIGRSALAALTSGQNNTAVGYQALDAATDSDHNTAVGYQALSAVNGSGTGGNTAVGRLAGATITSGTANTAVGHVALYQDDDGSSSVAIGSHSLFTQNISNAISGNTGVGTEAGYSNITGINNTYVGYKAGAGAGGSHGENTGVGASALVAITTGVTNTCIGRNSGTAITIGTENTLVGDRSGVNIVGGDFNQIIGTNMQVSGADAQYQILIGHNYTGTADNTFSFGRASNFATSTTFTTSGSCTFAFPSDERKKRNIKDNTIGLDLINDLQTRTFQWKPAEEHPEEWEAWDEDEEGNRVYHEMDTEKVMHGFIAQEVKETLDKYGVTDSLEVWAENEKTGEQRVGEHNFVTILIKAVQELSAKVKALEDAQ